MPALADGWKAGRCALWPAESLRVGTGLDLRTGFDLDSRKEQERTIQVKRECKEARGSGSHTLVGIRIIWGTCEKYKGPALSYFNQPGPLCSLSAL